MELEACKKRALRILGKRNFSEAEMHKRLISKGETSEAACETVKWLVEMGYINDENYASLIVNHYAGKGYGEARIRDELLKRGIPRSLWDEHLSTLEEQHTDAAIEFLRKKLHCRKLCSDTDKEEIQRTTQALVRRGFGYDEAKSIINKYINESDESEL